MSKPRLKTYANLWTLWDHPVAGEGEWDLGRKVGEIAATGFDGVMGDLGTGVGNAAKEHGLAYIAFSRLDGRHDFCQILLTARDEEAVVLQVHLGWHDTGADDALRWALALNEASRRLDLEAVIETHRDTCTETPEKTADLRRRFRAASGGMELPLLLDFSHPAVVKHLMPPWAPLLLDEPEVARRARWHHLRPFNGHHAQVPVLRSDHRTFTEEAEEWLRFVRELFAVMRSSPLPEVWFCPEIGPLRSGYGMSCFAPAWDEAVALRARLLAEWEKP